MGRPATPTALKLIAGNPGHRPINAKEPKSKLVKNLRPPSRLPASVATVWRNLAPKLARAGVLTEMDLPLLELTCSALAMHRHTLDKTEGDLAVTVNDENGKLSMSSWAVLQSMAFKQGIQALQQWGMTPVSRAKVMVEPDADPFEAKKAAEVKRFFK